jgi:hypothetical protein
MYSRLYTHTQSTCHWSVPNQILSYIFFFFIYMPSWYILLAFGCRGVIRDDGRGHPGGGRQLRPHLPGPLAAQEEQVGRPVSVDWPRELKEKMWVRWRLRGRPVKKKDWTTLCLHLNIPGPTTPPVIHTTKHTRTQTHAPWCKPRLNYYFVVVFMLACPGGNS